MFTASQLEIFLINETSVREPAVMSDSLTRIFIRVPSILRHEGRVSDYLLSYPCFDGSRVDADKTAKWIMKNK